MTAEAAATFVVTLGRRIREERERLGMSQGELAEYLSVTQPTVSSWECGRAVMSVVTERRILAYFKQRESAQKAVTA